MFLFETHFRNKHFNVKKYQKRDEEVGMTIYRYFYLFKWSIGSLIGIFQKFFVSQK